MIWHGVFNDRYHRMIWKW